MKVLTCRSLEPLCEAQRVWWKREGVVLGETLEFWEHPGGNGAVTPMGGQERGTKCGVLC